MNVIDMYDYYFFDRPCRKQHTSACTFELCEKSIVYRRVAADRSGRGYEYEHEDILIYMQYNVSSETGLPSYYSCCMNYNGEHVCNAIPIMIGSRLERKLIMKLCANLGIEFESIYDENYLHKVYAATFMVNGTFYYSVFRESNNNKMCHNTKSKFRGEETVAYFYDTKYNRGIKMFTGKSGHLKINNRDGKEISNVTKDTLAQLYSECLQQPEHYTLDTNKVANFFSAVKSQGFYGIDSFKNKIYTNYTIGLNTCLDKLHPAVVSHPMWNTSLMMGKVNLGISQRLSYPKSKSEVKKQNEQKLKMCTGGMSTGYLVESQRRRNTRKLKQTEEEEQICNKINFEASSCTTKQSNRKVSNTMFGSNEVKASGLIEKLENGEKNGPSMFNQVTVPYLPFVRLLSATVQKLQVEHVHAESSKTVPKDAACFICMKYVGNISTAGKNMLFTERVHVSYGHVQEIVKRIENGLQMRSEGLVSASESEKGLRIVVNNAVTKYILNHRRSLFDFMIWLKCTVNRFVWIKPIKEYICVYFFEGVPMLEYKQNERLYTVIGDILSTNDARQYLDTSESVCLTRNELELIRSETELLARKSVINNCFKGSEDDDELNNIFLIEMFKRIEDIENTQRVITSSLLAKQLDQYTDYTPPSKRSVSVNARKSACVNVYFQKAAALIRGFNIFTDPEGYEKKVAKHAYQERGIPVRTTLEQFRMMREENNNCPQPQFDTETGNKTVYDATCDLYALRNFYMLRTIFADIDGFNVEDANVIDESVDLCLRFSYSFSLTFLDKTTRGVDVLIPPPRDSVRVCGWNKNGDPIAVLFMVCTIRTDGSEHASKVQFPNGECDESVDDPEIQKTVNGVALRNAGIHFPPFRKVSVIMSRDGSYHVYFLRNDAVLLRSIRKQREEWMKQRKVFNDDPFCTVEEINPYDVLDSLQTKVYRFAVSESGERVVTVDFRAHGCVDKYDGIKVVNSFGQKGLALIKDLQSYVTDNIKTSCAPVQLVMNVCSFVSRQPIGQFLQMKNNFSTNICSVAGEPCLTGFSSVFFTESEPTTKTCLVRLDEMMRSVIITIGLTSFQNIKSSLDNVYNPKGLLCPPQARQILSLYRCYGIGYNLVGDSYEPYSTRDEVENIFRLFDVCIKDMNETTDTKAIKNKGKKIVKLKRLRDTIKNKDTKKVKLNI